MEDVSQGGNIRLSKAEQMQLDLIHASFPLNRQERIKRLQEFIRKYPNEYKENPNGEKAQIWRYGASDERAALRDYRESGEH